MKIITISGLDGSGKTTQLENLKSHLEKQGKSVYHFHMIEFSLANRLLGNRRKKTSGPAKAVTKASKLAIQLRKFALIVDAFRFNQLVIALQLGGIYDYLLTDRYFYDQIVNIHYLAKSANKPGFLNWQKLTERILKKPDCAIFLKVSPTIALSREREIEQGEQFLLDKQQIFAKFIARWKIHTISGEGTVKEVFKRILQKVQSY